MTVTDATELLRAGLLDGVSVMLAGVSGEPPGKDFGAAVAHACLALGANVRLCQPDALAEEQLDAEIACAGEIDLLVVDGAALFDLGLGGDGSAHLALRRCVDCAWNAIRAVVNLVFLADDRGGRIVLIAPANGAGIHADAAVAGLENLVRTLSVEWARHAITAVTIAPGAESSPGEVAALTAYLASPAGTYFSGCLLDLRAV